MKQVDRVLQRWRFRMVRRNLPPASSVLDIGAHQGELFAYLGDRIGPSVGIEPSLERDVQIGEHRLLAGGFPDRSPAGPFDAATLLAVVEHMTDDQIDQVAKSLAELVRPGGSIIVTVPSPAVDKILDVLIALRVLDGMEAEEHHGFDVDVLASRWEACGLELRKRCRFQLGLNNLFVFSAPSA